MTRARALLLLLSCTACDSAPPPPPFEPVADVRQLMASILEPAAEVYWDAVGTIIDKNGTTEIAPSSDEEWIAVRNSAFVITEAGNLLMMGSRAADSGDWMTMSRAMIVAGRRAIEAADSRTPSAVFDVGADLYATCTSCHAKYAVELLRPNVVR